MVDSEIFLISLDRLVARPTAIVDEAKITRFVQYLLKISRDYPLSRHSILCAASTKLAGRPSRHRRAHSSNAAEAMPALPQMDMCEHAA